MYSLVQEFLLVHSQRLRGCHSWGRRCRGCRSGPPLHGPSLQSLRKLLHNCEGCGPGEGERGLSGTCPRRIEMLAFALALALIIAAHYNESCHWYNSMQSQCSYGIHATGCTVRSCHQNSHHVFRDDACLLEYGHSYIKWVHEGSSERASMLTCLHATSIGFIIHGFVWPIRECVEQFYCIC